MSDTLDPRQRRVLRAAERFAAFQEPDSLTHQQCDVRLRQSATAALEELLDAVAAAPCATCDGRGGRFDDGTEYCNCDD